MITQRTRNLTGMASLALGVLVFSTQDAIIKAISGDYAVTQAIFTRCVVSFPILLLMVHIEAGIGSLVSRNAMALAARGLMLMVAYTTYYMAFPSLPLAEAIALFFVSPIVVTVLAGPLLGERVGFWSWIAVFIGFVGVLIILQPGTALFEPAALFSLVSAIAYALSMIFARRLGVTEPASVMTFYQNGVYLLGALAIAGVSAALGVTKAEHPSVDFLVRPWMVPQISDLLLMGLCGVIAAVGAFLLAHAYRLAEANLVTVIEYTGMIWGVLWGFLFFAEIPRWTTFAGMLLIFIAGIISLRAASQPKLFATAEI